MMRAAAWAGRLSAAPRAGTAVVLGALAALTLPPLYVLPLLVVALTGLLWLLDGACAAARSRRQAFVLGWCFGFGHFVTGLYWIANALLVDAERFGWLAPVAVAGLSAYFALYPAAAVLAAAWVRPGVARVVALAAAWTLAEYVRGVVLTGFPWNPMGSVLAIHPALIQGAALGGVFALSFLVVLMAALPATLAGANAADGTLWRRAGPSVTAAAMFGLVLAGGAVRLALAPAAGSAPADAPRVRVVQGAIPQTIKWRPELVREHFNIYLSLSRGAPAGGAGSDRAPAAVIWPETAVPAVFDGSAEYTRAVAQAAPPGGIVITGVVRRDPRPAPGMPAAVWNAIIAVDGRGRLLARYDKHHLVPFGEYVPLKRFNPLPKLTEGRVDFSAGSGPVTLSLPGLPPLSPLVCYEAIFPAAVTAGTGPRPGLLLNLTNDAWFGTATGPYQHLVAARLRAVEEGLPLVRAANTGISALVDSYGRVIASIGLGRRGVFDVALPEPPLAPTVFTRLGNAPIVLISLLILCLTVVFRRLRP
ncbi:MAG: apolipoprotein N-acyltransferase [Alphaproteobacteria bacterium]|nr:apolipoprotein N-acyltransferase [Alphaproteobacteria bacterium]